MMTAISKKGVLSQRIQKLSNATPAQKRSNFLLPFLILFLGFGSLTFLSFRSIPAEDALNKDITVEAMKAMKEINIEAVSNLDAACEVVSYEITRVPAEGDPVSEKSSQSIFTGRVLALVESAGKGDVYYVDKLKVKCPEDKEPRKIGGIIFKVK